MKKNILKFSVLIVLLFTVSLTMGQNYKQSFNDLKIQVQKSLYKSDLTLSDDGTILRKDNNGNSFSFNIKDVDSFISVYDGFHNLIVTMKKGKFSTSNIKGSEEQSDMNVFSFSNPSDCKKAIDLFQKLQKEFK